VEGKRLGEEAEGEEREKGDRDEEGRGNNALVVGK